MTDSVNVETDRQGGGVTRAAAKPVRLSPTADTLVADTDRDPSHGPFGAMLEPALRHTCGDRLSHVSWFRTDWQRGGALTGYARMRDAQDPDLEHDVVVKLPVPPIERRWLSQLQNGDTEVAPRVFAHGEQLNGYDLAWVVMERLPHGPLGVQWGGSAFDLVADAAARFYAVAADIPVEGKTADLDWPALLHQAREHVQRGDIAEQQRWKDALKKAHRKLDEWLAIWNDRPKDQWCHGDLHLGNALTRTPPPEGPALLIDFANTHVGCWVEDAVYFEHLFWARRDRLEGRKICKAIAQARKEYGLRNEPDWPQLADIKRLLLAVATPTQLRHKGDPHHVQAALEVLERHVK